MLAARLPAVLPGDLLLAAGRDRLGRDTFVAGMIELVLSDVPE